LLDNPRILHFLEEAANVPTTKTIAQRLLVFGRAPAGARPKTSNNKKKSAILPQAKNATTIDGMIDERNGIMALAAQVPAETNAAGAFVRQEYSIRDRITADGSSGFLAEPGRYHLYVSLACPWAHRAIIVRGLLGLETVISMSVVDPIRDELGWAFRDGPGYSRDPINGFAFLSQAYLATDPGYTGRYTVPCIWDRVTERLVTNNYPDITIDFETLFQAYQRPNAPNLYPEPLRPEIDEVNALIYEDVNNGVYGSGRWSNGSARNRCIVAQNAFHTQIITSHCCRISIL
jgi:glutathionyl-hydroquinone reductase